MHISFAAGRIGEPEPTPEPPPGARGAPQSIVLQTRHFGGRADAPFALEVLGESYRQDALWNVVSEATPDADGMYRVETVATLVPEPGNKSAVHSPSDSYNEKAIAVHLSSGHVGYLRPEDAAAYSEALDALRAAGVAVSCTARIVGGAGRTGGPADSLSVWLDLDYPERLLEPSGGRPAPLTPENAPVTRDPEGPRAEHGIVRGRHYTEYVEVVKDLKRRGALDEAEALLLEIIEAVESESQTPRFAFARWYYEQLAIIRRKKRDFVGEIAIIERQLALDQAPPARRAALLVRLEQARAQLAKAVSGDVH